MKNPIKYTFDDFSHMVTDKYIIQMVSNRILSKIYHYHDFYEIVILLNGETHHYINGILHTMQAGDCVILKPGDAHSFTWQSDNLIILVLSISCKEFDRFANSFSIFHDLIFCQPFSCSQHLSELSTLSELSYTQKKPANLKLLLCNILYYYSNGLDNTQSNIPPSLKNAVDKMYDADNIKTGLPALLSLSNYSYSHLYRLMKEFYGKTPHQFLTQIRMEYAYNLLSSTDLPIADISENIGYNSFNHFNTVFTNTYGISPAKFVKNKNSNFTI